MPRKPIPTNFAKTRKSLGIIRGRNGKLKKTIATKIIEPSISKRNIERHDRQVKLNDFMNKYIFQKLRKRNF